MNQSLFSEIIEGIVSNPQRHFRWILTLSYLEHCGARKLARYEAQQAMNTELLQHVTEEFRHAEFLRRQAQKCNFPIPHKLSPHDLLGTFAAWHYIHRLEAFIVRELKASSPTITNREVAHSAYVLVTFAIEKRAQFIYEIYDQALIKHKIGFRVSSIIFEEVEHLGVISKHINKQLHLANIALKAIAFEEENFKQWIIEL